ELSKIQGNEYDWANEDVIINHFNEVETIRFARSLSVGQTLVLLIKYYDTHTARAAKESINGLENKFEDMAKVSLSTLKNSTVISSDNRAIPKKNTLDIERIRNGLDDCTTLIIRNIPNKYNQ
ncbi:4650_t:CDS:2, partial [Racocetra persica]